MLCIVLLSPLARIAPGAAARRWLRLLGWAGLVLFGLLGVAAPVGAEAGAALDASLLDDVRALALGKAAESGGSRVEVTIGQLDPRLHLAPCQNIEPYLPPGVRLWGKARIGLRCKTGPTPWNVYLPVTVKVFGRALVVPAGAAAGSVLAEADRPRPRSTWPRNSPPPWSTRAWPSVGRWRRTSGRARPCARPTSRAASGSSPARPCG
jgi:flagella basal body P-ring formation protein FlgA